VDEYGRLAGIITSANCAAWDDFSRRSSVHAINREHPDLTPVREISSSAAEHIHEDAPASEVVDRLVNRRARRIYVVNKDSKVVGVVSMADLIRHFIDSGNEFAHSRVRALAMC
jgi:CBS-domain-containing membrane protein